MSSSRIFKHDPDFTPTPLVQHELNIAPVGFQEETVPEETAEEEHELAHGEIVVEMEAPEQTTPEEEIQQPAIDVQALQDEAYAKGASDMASRLEAQIGPAVEAFNLACQKIDKQRHALLSRYREEIINSVIALSRKVIGDELQTKRDVIANILEKALRQAISNDEFVVTIHPDDLTVVEEKTADLIAETRGLKHLTIKSDPTITRGGCFLESNNCLIDATIEAQLKKAGEFLEEHTTIPELDSNDPGDKVTGHDQPDLDVSDSPSVV